MLVAINTKDKVALSLNEQLDCKKLCPQDPKIP